MRTDHQHLQWQTASRYRSAVAPAGHTPERSLRTVAAPAWHRSHGACPGNATPYGCIGDGQRIAAHAVSGSKPAFEIGAPRVVGLADRTKRLRARWHVGAWRTPRDRQPSTRQDGP